MTATTEDLADTTEFTADALSEVLKIVHVSGEAARKITSDRMLNTSVHDGKPCVYIVERGELKIQIEGEPPVVLRQNQVALMLQGVAHTATFSKDPSSEVTNPKAGKEHQAFIECFWGSFKVDSELATRVLRSLPKIIVMDDLCDQPIDWIDTVCELVLDELGATRPGASLMVSRLLDLLLVIIIRRWAQTEDSLPGWLAAAKDERIARAVSAIHSNSMRTFTNAELAEFAGMSESSFKERFKFVMGVQPGAYIRGWRLDQAAEALLHSSTTIDVIAERVGYTSKEAFSRAFQSQFGVAPSVWRSARQEL